MYFTVHLTNRYVCQWIVSSFFVFFVYYAADKGKKRIFLSEIRKIWIKFWSLLGNFLDLLKRNVCHFVLYLKTFNVQNHFLQCFLCNILFLFRLYLNYRIRIPFLCSSSFSSSLQNMDLKTLKDRGLQRS